MILARKTSSKFAVPVETHFLPPGFIILLPQVMYENGPKKGRELNVTL